MSPPTAAEDLRRAVRIALRTGHIGAAVLVMGAAVTAGPGAVGDLAMGALVFSGVGIVADDLLKYGVDWLRYVMGAAVVGKVALLAMGWIWPAALVPCLWGALVVGSIVSHAPGRLRHFPLWGGSGPCAVTAPAAEPSAPERAAGDGRP